MLWAFFGIAAFPLATGFINPKFYELERDLRFSKEFLSAIANKFVGVAVSIAVAAVFRTYWAIILGLFAGGLVQLVLSYALRPYAPRFGLRAFRRLFGLSGWLAGVSFVSALNNKLDAPILARVAGTGGAGFYYMGVQLSELAANQIAAPFMRAIYPGLSSLQNDPARMRSAYLQGVEALSLVLLPAAFGLGFIAEDAALLLLGEQWRAAGPLLALLAPALGLQALFAGVHGYAVAVGRARTVFFRELTFFILRAPVFVWAAVAYGLAGAVWAAAFASLLHAVLNLALYAKASGSPFWEPALAARRSFGAVAGMAVYFLLVRPLTPFPDALPLALRLCVDMAAGAAVYGGLHAALWVAAGRPKSAASDMLALAAAMSGFSRAPLSPRNKA